MESGDAPKKGAKADPKAAKEEAKASPKSKAKGKKGEDEQAEAKPPAKE